MRRSYILNVFGKPRPNTPWHQWYLIAIAYAFADGIDGDDNDQTQNGGQHHAAEHQHRLRCITCESKDKQAPTSVNSRASMLTRSYCCDIASAAALPFRLCDSRRMELSALYT